MKSPDFDHIERISSNFVGNMLELESAIGCYCLCFTYGWRVMKIIHGKHKWKRYCEILEVDLQAPPIPEETSLSRKNLGYRVWKETGRFFHVLEGRISPPDGRKSDLVA